ncbi:helix-turn-helix transcriptional regulator [Hoeflea sp.]|uniref:helix-turn-helix domain-containing protein n=1 Tax=Hoeflea sp. TaxID=1940281 RepID=UPI002AFFEC1C|nr:helix-turn-helix transcriptional regulator [Hoeflea sp.]
MSGLQNSRNPLLADFDWRQFAQAIKTRCVADGRSQWEIAKDIGITESDLSRVRGGQIVSVAKAVALARWLKRPLESWYLAPLPDPSPDRIKTTSCSGSNVKHAEAAE